MVQSLTISELASSCRTEAERYKRLGHSNEVYCFELFRRALSKQDQAAWAAIVSQFQRQVITWVHNYSQFLQTEEDADFFANEAFTRMWKSASKLETAKKLDTLGKCLQYLKSCIASAIEDYLRRANKDALRDSITLNEYQGSSSSTRESLLDEVLFDQLKEELWEIVQDEAERIVAEDSWVYGLTPRAIQARHPDIFATPQVVNQVKRNIIRRLQRKLGPNWLEH